MSETYQEKRTAIMAMIHELHKAIAALDNHAESMLLGAVDEREHQPKVRKVRYGGAASDTTTDGAHSVAAPSMRTKYSTNAGERGTPEEILATRTHKRACSICRQPGHRATTCPSR